MDLKRFTHYISLFNAQDWGGLSEEFFSPDIKLRFPVAQIDGAVPAARLVFAGTTPTCCTSCRLPLCRSGSHHRTATNWSAGNVCFFILTGQTDKSPAGHGGTAGDTVEVDVRTRYRLTDSGHFDKD